MEREVGRDGLGSEGASVFLFIDQFDSAHPDCVVIEIEFLGVVDGMAEFDFMPDVRESKERKTIGLLRGETEAGQFHLTFLLATN